MPRNPKSNYRKKNYRRKKRSNYNQMVSIRPPFARSYLTKHRYCASISINPALSSTGNHIFSANGLYDSDITGTGHQVLGFDQLTPIYDHYTVLGSKLKATFVSNSNSGSTGAANVMISVSDSASPVTSLETVREQGGAVVGLMTNTNAVQSVVLVKTFSTKKFFNRSDVKDCSELRGASNANPTEQAYFILTIDPLDSSLDVAGTWVQVEIEYITLWTEPKQLAQS